MGQMHLLHHYSGAFFLIWSISSLFQLAIYLLTCYTQVQQRKNSQNELLVCVFPVYGVKIVDEISKALFVFGQEDEMTAVVCIHQSVIVFTAEIAVKIFLSSCQTSGQNTTCIIPGRDSKVTWIYNEAVVMSRSSSSLQIRLRQMFPYVYLVDCFGHQSNRIIQQVFSSIKPTKHISFCIFFLELSFLDQHTSWTLYLTYFFLLRVRVLSNATCGWGEGLQRTSRYVWVLTPEGSKCYCFIFTVTLVNILRKIKERKKENNNFLNNETILKSTFSVKFVVTLESNYVSGKTYNELVPLSIRILHHPVRVYCRIMTGSLYIIPYLGC